MHYVTRICHRMLKHKFGITCPDALFVESVPVTSENDKKCVDVLRPGCIGMNYVTHRAHRMQKYKFGVTCPARFLLNPS
jgi:hypothetical protein